MAKVQGLDRRLFVPAHQPLPTETELSIAPLRPGHETPSGSDAFGDFVRTLRVLIDEADASTARLGALLDRAEDGGGRAQQASMRIQERLRLGAQMLKAFQRCSRSPHRKTSRS